MFFGLGADTINARYDGQRTPFTVTEGIPVDAMLEAEFIKDGFVIVKKTLPKIEEDRVPEPFFAELTAEAGTEQSTVVVTSVPAGAEVFIDGERRGVTPLNDARVDGGTQHKVEVRLGGFNTYESGLYTEPGERKFVEAILVKGNAAPEPAAHVALTPTPAPATKPSVKPREVARDDDDKPAPSGGKGFVTIDASVALKVYVGDRLLGETPLKRVALETGNQKLRLTNEREGITVTRKVRITSGSTETLNISLKKGSLAVNATPWAWVRVGSRQAVETPTRLDLFEGDYAVRLECPDGKQIKDTAHVVAGKTATMSASCR